MRKTLVLFVVSTIVAICCGMLNTINCPDCGTIVSVRAFMCPKCGCAREAIQQHVKAVDALSRLPPDQQKNFSLHG